MADPYREEEEAEFRKKANLYAELFARMGMKLKRAADEPDFEAAQTLSDEVWFDIAELGKNARPLGPRGMAGL